MRAFRTASKRAPAWCSIIWLLLGLAVSAAPAVAAPELAPLNPKQPDYFPVGLNEQGKISSADLDGLVASLTPEIRNRPAQIVLLIHGYDTSLDLGRREYRQVARQLQEEADRLGLRVLVVGVHWPSYPGRWQAWIPQMVGYRFTSELGFKHAVRNPYLEKVALSAECGRRGLRTLLFRLQDSFPETPLNLFAHSMGGEMVVRALSAESASAVADPETTLPERVLRVQMATLAGADLDNDVFSRREKDSAETALDRARLWWITVPRRNVADAVLELRRSAGRRDAVGNVGLTLEREEFDGLMRRGGLVLDDRHVPIGHDLTEYYAPERLRSLARALVYLRDPAAPGAQPSTLSRMAALRALPTNELPEPSQVSELSARLVVRWRLHPERDDFGLIRIARKEPRETLHSLRPFLYNLLVAQPAGCGAA